MTSLGMQTVTIFTATVKQLKINLYIIASKKLKYKAGISQSGRK